MSSLNPVFTIEDQMLAVLKWRGTPEIGLRSYLRYKFNREELIRGREYAADLLSKMHIPDPHRVLRSYPFQLSGGMRQRVLIANALIGRPPLIIADEPGTGLDVSVLDTVLDLIQERVSDEKVSVLYITHDLAIARRLCDRIYVMYSGNVVELADSGDLFLEPRHPYSVGLLESVPRISGSIGLGIPGSIPSYYDPPTGCRFHPRCKFAMKSCKAVKPELTNLDSIHAAACHLYTQGE